MDNGYGPCGFQGPALIFEEGQILELRPCERAIASSYRKHVGDEFHDHKNHTDHTLRRSETGHLGPAQEGQGLSATPLSGELRSIDLQQPRRLRGPDPGGRGGWPLRQPGGDPHHHRNGRGQRLWPGAGGLRRPALDTGSLLCHPQAQGLWRHHPLGQPQPRRARRRFRHQIQHQQRRPGAGEDHRRDLRQQPDHQRIQKDRGSRDATGQGARVQGRRDGGHRHRSGQRLRRADGRAVRLRCHQAALCQWLSHALRRHARHYRPLRPPHSGRAAGRAGRDGDQRHTADRLRQGPPRPQPHLRQGAGGGDVQRRGARFRRCLRWRWRP